MKNLSFIKPSITLDEKYINETNYCKVYISPLERGYGQTLGNSLRRVLLSSLVHLNQLVSLYILF